MSPAEILKRNPDEFAGFQMQRLPIDQICIRMCCAARCSTPGRSQMAVPGGGYRIVCGRHMVLCHMMELGILGDTSPIAEIRNLCETLSVNWEELLRSEPIHPTLPENFSCLRCGGRYIVETVGMFAGKRYIHNCGS